MGIAGERCVPSLGSSRKDADLKDYQNKYIAVIRSAFEMEPVTVDRPEVIDKLMARGFKIGTFRINDKKEKYAIKSALSCVLLILLTKM